MTSEGWTGYAPLDAEPPPCSFCRDPERQVMVAPGGEAAICMECAERIAGVMRRAGRPPEPRDA
jgi:ClpX C4-type zinc finger